MKPFDWSTFILKIYINASMNKVYDSWTIRTNLEKFFLKKAEFTKPDGSIRDNNSPIETGDTYEWTWHGYLDENAEHGNVLAANGSDSFQFVFGKAGTVTVNLKEKDGLTEVLLTQDNIPTDEKSKVNYHVNCSKGWTFYLANLKSILEGGIDLRNKNANLTNVINS